jgi:hypothetical protein
MNEIRFKKSDTVKVIAELASYIDSLDSEKEYILTLKEHKQKRSLNANSYFWELCGKLAEKTHIPKTEIYRSYIKEIGGNSEIICIQDKALKHFREIWEQGHIGRFTEICDSKLKGCTNVIVYYGSSDYDTACMSRLIEMVVQDCVEQEIPTYNQAELQKLCDEWGVE